LWAYHLDLLAWHSTTHVRAASRREQRSVAQLVDALLPSLGGFLSWVDVLDALLVRLFDRVLDPATLNLYGGWAVGEEGRSVGSVQVVAAER
jgi:hypothetical protein